MKAKFLLGLALILSALEVQAKVTSYKYAIIPSFGILNSCKPEGKRQLSQIRLEIDEDAWNENQNVVVATAKITVCTLGGGFLKDTFDIPLPKEFFVVQSKVTMGNRILGGDFFTALTMKPTGTKDLYEISYMTQQGPWNTVNPITVHDGRSAGYKAPDAINLRVVQRNMWLKTKLRLIEAQD